MNGQSTTQDGKRTIVAVTIILLIVDLVLVALALTLGPLELFGPRSQTASAEEAPASQEPPTPEMQPEPAAEELPASPEPREAPESYRVQPGDTLYDITRAVWGDEDLWPLVYARNSASLANPDRISPFTTLALGVNPAADGALSPSESRELLEGYVTAYKAYRRAGEEALESGRRRSSEYLLQQSRLLVNKAHWLLYRGLAFDEEFLDRFSDEIQERDRRVVEEYLRRFGAPSE